MITTIEAYINKHFPKNKGWALFGSSIYGTTNSQSDIDIIVIDDDLKGQTRHQGGYDIQFISEVTFRNKLRECEIKILEFFFTDKKQLKIKVSEKDINWNNLRSSISERSSHSFVKAKKKFKDQEFYIGKKSLFHSLRILKFGIQLATHKKIVDFSGANELLIPILSHPQDSESLDSLLAQHKLIYNELHSQFKLLSPKNNHK